MIERQEALELLKDNLQNENLVKHCLASEAVMRKLASHRGRNTEVWGLTGLLHDLDYRLTAEDPSRHGLAAAEMLEGKLPKESLRAIKAHNQDYTGIKRESDFEHLLAAGESLTGLIVAVALVYPGKKLAPVKVKSVTKRMRMKAFARSVPRETIKECEKAGYELREFVELALEAMKEISDDLGL